MERIAFIEVSCFSAKLIIAETKQNHYYNIIEKQVDDLELGVDLDKDHFLKKSQIENTIKVLKNFRKLCDVYNVNSTVAVATFIADCKPKNIISFFDEIYTECGFKFDLIENSVQNQNLYYSVINTLDVPKGVACLVDFDSIRLIQYSRRNIINQAVLPFGPYTLVEKFEGEDSLEKIKNYIAEEIQNLDWQIGEDEVQIVGAGKFFEDLAIMVKKYKKYPIDLTNAYFMDKEDIEYVGKQIRTLGLDKTKRIKGLTDARADLFLVSVEIIEELIKYFNNTKVALSNGGILEGVIINTVIPMTQEKPIADVLGFSLTALSSIYDPQNTKHNDQVANLAMLLFRQLRVIHKLPRTYMKVLRAAAYLHDSGQIINFDQHAKHGFYVTLNSGVAGITHRETVLAAFVVSLHEGGEIYLPEWVRYGSLLNEEDIDAVRKLGTILRLAESFDRSKNNVISDINCDILGYSVILKTESNGDSVFEITEANKVGKEFEKNFSKKLEIL